MRSKKRNYLTTDKEIVALAYCFHVCAQRLRETVTQMNIPAAYRLQILRHVQWLINQAKSLNKELTNSQENVFDTKEQTEEMADRLRLFQ